MYKKIAIIYLLYADEPYKYLDQAFKSIEHQTYPKELMELVVVYNPPKSDEHSACCYIREQIDKRIMNLPHAVVLEQATNLGFVGGNNAGMRWAMDHGCDLVFLHNGDGDLDGRAIEELAKAMDVNEKIGAVQSLVLLDPEKHLINTAGNNFHYLGFGYCGLYRQPRESLSSDEVQEVGYLSGSAMMMRIDLLKEYGLWDEDLFIYHDDLEYSLRLQSLGYKTVMAPKSVFYHQYHFSRNKDKYYLMERNRYAIMLQYMKWPTLLLLAPMNLLVELGILAVAEKNGWIKNKLKAYWYWLSIKNWKRWLSKRATVQRQRMVGDKELLKNAVSKIVFEDIDNWVLRNIANPLMGIYWRVVKKIIKW
ncbi:MAG: glycosyltransferase family 2 protein [bacterium]